MSRRYWNRPLHCAKARNASASPPIAVECVICAVTLQLRAHPDIDRERLRRRDHAGVVQHVRDRDRDCRPSIEESADSREFAIEQIVDEAVDLDLLGELIGPVQIRDPVVGELRVLVGVIANKPLATDPDDVGAELQLRRKPIIDAALNLVPRYAGNLLAWRDKDISICVRERIVR
jgi:hypothetical protein